MSVFIITVNNGTDEGSLRPDLGFAYTENLNEINEAELKFSSLSTTLRTLLTMGANVTINKDGTNRFYGPIDSIDNVTGGGIVIHASGYEIWMTKEPRTYAGSPWVGTASATIATAIISESTHVALGSVTAGINIDLRLEKSDTLWNALGMVCKKTGQDTSVSYLNTASITMSIVNHKGSSTSRQILNNGFELTNPRYTLGHPTGNYIEVFGKGDGANQIKSTSAYGQDAASQATYGIIYRPVVNRNVMTVDEANQLADKEVLLTKDPIEIYTFTMTDITVNILAGEVVTINAEDLGISSVDVRVTQVKRGMNGRNEFLEISVANANYAKLVKTRDRYLGDITRQSLQESTQMQGNSNVDVWGGGINAKTNYPLKIGFYIDTTNFVDEAGVLRINSITLDYDIDKYKAGYGTASYTGSDPQVQNTSGNTQPDVAGTSGSTTPSSVAGVSVWAALTVDGTAYKALCHAEENISGSPTLYTARAVGLYMNVTGASQTVDKYVEFPSGTTSHSSGSLANNSVIYYSAGESNASDVSGYYYFWDNNYAVSYVTGTAEIIYTHTHGSHSHSDGTFAAADHSHPDGSYDINAADLNSISIGDDVSEAAGVNSTSINIYLDYYTGGVWVNKYSILNTGTTLANDVDISNAGTYPDAAGYWRVRVEPITATPDFAQGIVKIKHVMDN